jgi:hypothetical protein
MYFWISTVYNRFVVSILYQPILKSTRRAASLLKSSFIVIVPITVITHLLSPLVTFVVPVVLSL